VVTVNYPLTFEYRHIPNAGLQPAVEVVLTNGERTARAVAILDSGATHTVFSCEIAELLGIEDVTTGSRVSTSTFGGPFEFYLFDLHIRFPSDHQSFSGQIGFSPGRTPRNMLERILFFSRFEVGFRETRQRMNLRPEG
jgi:hypothetical protein